MCPEVCIACHPVTTPQVWVSAELDAAGKVRFAADSDSELTRGLAALLVEGLSGLTPDEVLQVSRCCTTKLHFGGVENRSPCFR